MKGNIKNILIATTILLSLHALKGNASTNDSVIVKRNLNLPNTFFFDAVYRNPGALFELPSLDQGQVEAGFKHEARQNLHLLYEGTSLTLFDMNAEGSSKKGNSVFFGKASYKNTNKQNVAWTNVSDNYRLGPYIIADSVGGNFYGEEYSLSGGFSTLFEKLTVGIEAGYRGGSEYRKRDPRPKTIVSDLFAKIGTGYPLEKYQMGISVLGGIYRQHLDISVEEPHTDYRFHFMTGFGQTDLLWSATGSSYSADYLGNFYGASAFILPFEESGFIGNFDYRTESIDSRLGSYSDSNKYPSTFSTNQYSILAGYKLSRPGKRTWFKADVNYETGKGTERVYKKQSTSENVVLISENKKYTRNVSTIGLSVLQEWNSTAVNKWIEAKVGYNIYEELYASPSYKVHYLHINMNLKGGMEISLKKQHAILAEIGLSYQPLINEETRVPSTDKLFIYSMLPNMKVWETSPYGASVKFLYQFPVKNSVLLYVVAQGATLIANKDMNRQTALLTIGFRY